MVTTIRLTYIQNNLQRGDRAEIAKSLKINKIIVYDVISGKIKEGAHGKAIIRKAEKIITKRLQQIERDKQKFDMN